MSCQINANQHSVESPLRPQQGSCLVPSAALINHSCSPNVHHFSDGPELVIRSLRRIAKDEELTISYIDATQCFKERQEAVSSKYGFGCQCVKCVKGYQGQGEVLNGEPVHDAQVRSTKLSLHALLEPLAVGTQELDDVEKQMQRICAETTSGKPWPIDAYPLPYLYQSLARKCELEQRWKKALRYQLQIVYLIDPLRYPERLNPHRVDSLMALCQLEGYVVFS